MPQAHSDRTHFDMRRHPEDFGSNMTATAAGSAAAAARPATHVLDRQHPQHQHPHHQHPSYYNSKGVVLCCRMWNVPRRNKLFVGRELELSEIFKRLHAADAGAPIHPKPYNPKTLKP